MKPLGIWGLGVVGQSVARYCLAHNIPISLLNDRSLTPEQLKFLQDNHLSCLQGPENIEPFLTNHDQILVSAGIDLRQYQAHAHKFIAELDLFAQEWHKPFIAITGTVGKTTVTHVLGHVLNYLGIKTALGGNIGVGLCDILETASEAEQAILEVSSFQLELSKSFAADLAIWTNFSPNHLDRHSSLDEYRAAKNNLIMMQRPGQKALVPLALHHEIEKGAGDLFYFADSIPTATMLDTMPIFYFDHNDLRCNYPTLNLLMVSIVEPPKTLLRENWLIIASSLHLLGLTDRINDAAAYIDTLEKPEHRLEYIGTFKGKLFYNDSKATTPTATNAALAQFRDKSVTLILGGVSKGVDRTDFMRSLPSHISHVICFGKEAAELAAACSIAKVTICASLEDVIKIAHEKSAPGEIVLFSPAGASFDLFTNYAERGDLFKKLVRI